MIDKKRIEEESEHFFEWPTKDRTYVTRTSMLIFANTIAEMVRKESMAERDRLREALEAMLAIHTEPAGFEGQYGAKLTKFIEAQEVKVNAAIAKARQALEAAP